MLVFVGFVDGEILFAKIEKRKDNSRQLIWLDLVSTKLLILLMQ